MDKPKRSFLGKFSQNFIQKITKNLYLPKINPNKISALSVIFSILFIIFFNYSRIVSLFVLLLVLLFDFLDGAIAKRYYKEKIDGYIIDVTCDRISEGIIFSIFFFPWFFLFSINLWLTIWSFYSKKHIVLPLRHIFIFYLIIKIL
jgi:phosphatidylglycerophosphate synthase